MFYRSSILAEVTRQKLYKFLESQQEETIMRLTGHTDTCTLKGERFQLTLQGQQISKKGTVGTEYIEREVNLLFFRGMGVLTQLSTGTFQMFQFETWKEEKYNDRTLEQFILSFNAWDSSICRFKRDYNFSEQKKAQLVDLICENIYQHILSPSEEIHYFYFGHLGEEFLTLTA
jgi:hypothetical protein